jgi:hypothetical protein
MKLDDVDLIYFTRIKDYHNLRHNVSVVRAALKLANNWITYLEKLRERDEVAQAIRDPYSKKDDLSGSDRQQNMIETIKKRQENFERKTKKPDTEGADWRDKLIQDRIEKKKSGGKDNE